MICLLFTTVLPAKTPATKTKKRISPLEDQIKAVPGALNVPKSKPDEDSRKSAASPDATILPEKMVEYSGELPRVKKLIESALVLTTRNLTYTYNSNDPANGGMDCSGFISYLLQENGFTNVPRDASGQYVWLRKAGTFRPVLSQKPDTFELEELRPGDLLFWTGTYVTDHDPPVTHVMLYLGKEKGTNNRIMAGASDGRSYQGLSRWGVSIFDFQLKAPSRASGINPGRSVFVGYARPPGLRD